MKEQTSLQRSKNLINPEQLGKGTASINPEQLGKGTASFRATDQLRSEIGGSLISLLVGMGISSILLITLVTFFGKTQTGTHQADNLLSREDVKRFILAEIECEASIRMNSCPQSGSLVDIKDRHGSSINSFGPWRLRAVCTASRWGLNIQIAHQASPSQWMPLFPVDLETCPLDERITSLPSPDYESAWLNTGTTITHNLGTLDYIVEVEYREDLSDPPNFYQFAWLGSWNSTGMILLGFNQTAWHEKTENRITVVTRGQQFEASNIGTPYNINQKNAQFKVRLWKFN